MSDNMSMTTLGVLKRLEWDRDGNKDAVYCPCCAAEETQGHAPTCSLAAAIRKEENWQDEKLNAESIVLKHRLHVELSPGVGEHVQSYAIGVCDDILADLRKPRPQPLKERGK